MRVHYYKDNEVYLADNAVHANEDAERLETVVEISIQRLTKRRLFRELIMAYSQQTGLEGYIFLEAHGITLVKDGTEETSREYPWFFEDGKTVIELQEWINQIDGRKGVIYIGCCNPRNNNITSNVSIIVHPNTSVSLANLLSRRSFARLYMPNNGYLETSYSRLRRVLSKLQRSKV